MKIIFLLYNIDNEPAKIEGGVLYMLNIKNCKRCGKTFNCLTGSDICPVCVELEEQEFKKVKNYLYDHPGATLSEIVSALNTKVETIKKFLREERLEIVYDTNFILHCERCGVPIKTGGFCHVCNTTMINDLKIVNDLKHEHKLDHYGLRYLNKK